MRSQSWVGLVILGLLVVAIAGAPLWPLSPDAPDVRHLLEAPSARHWFGTDLFGRDVAARVLYGGRATLAIGLLVVGAAFTAGVLIGMVAGFCGGWVDAVLMRGIDTLLSIPSLVLAIALAAAFGAGLGRAMLAIAIAMMPQFARVARNEARRIGAMAYMEAAIVMGVSSGRRFLHYTLRNGLGASLTQAPLAIGSAILQTASLGFLGLGAQPPLAEWGADIAFNLDYVRGSPWLVAAPGVAIFLAVLAFNLIADQAGGDRK